MHRYASVLLLVAQAYQCQLVNMSPDASAVNRIASIPRSVVCHATLDAGREHKGALKQTRQTRLGRATFLDELGVASSHVSSSSSTGGAD